VGGKGPQVVWRKVPGLSLFGTSANSGFRGAILVDNTLYAAWSGKASRYTSGGVETTLTGTLNGTEKVFWARNNASDARYGLRRAWHGRFHGYGGAVSTFADTDVGAPNSVCFMDGFFIFSWGDGTLHRVGLNSVSSPRPTRPRRSQSRAD
jgi:hypothetical protein